MSNVFIGLKMYKYVETETADVFTIANIVCYSKIKIV